MWKFVIAAAVCCWAGSAAARDTFGIGVDQAVALIKEHGKATVELDRCQPNRIDLKTQICKFKGQSWGKNASTWSIELDQAGKMVSILLEYAAPIGEPLPDLSSESAPYSVDLIAGLVVPTSINRPDPAAYGEKMGAYVASILFRRVLPPLPDGVQVISEFMKSSFKIQIRTPLF